MTIEVGDIIKEFLKDLTFIDRLAGVVRVITKTDIVEKRKVISKFPVACDVSPEECVTSDKYFDLVPDSSKGCIVYLEDLGVIFRGQDGGKQVYKAKYKLVGWVNNAKLGYEDCSVTGKIIASIINVFPVVPFNDGIYLSGSVVVQGQEPKTGQNPFAKYSYDEKISQYLLYPFDYFSLFIDVNFTINKKCLVEFEKKTSIPCK